MKINSLSLKNIGPFINAEIDFTNNSNKNPVTIITGENGTGKSIIIDAIRAILSCYQGFRSRDIIRDNSKSFSISANLEYNNEKNILSTNEKAKPSILDKNKICFNVHDKINKT